jgi:hypothetical protein
MLLSMQDPRNGSGRTRGSQIRQLFASARRFTPPPPENVYFFGWTGAVILTPIPLNKAHKLPLAHPGAVPKDGSATAPNPGTKATDPSDLHLGLGVVSDRRSPEISATRRRHSPAAQAYGGFGSPVIIGVKPTAAGAQPRARRTW